MRCFGSCFDFLYDHLVERLGSSSMGASSSRAGPSEEELELQDLEARLGLDLQLLKNAFTRVSTDNVIYVPKLEHLFGMEAKRIKGLPDNLEGMLPHLGPAVVALIFEAHEEPQVSWLQFLKGFDSFQQTGRSARLRSLLVFYSELLKRAQVPSALQVPPGEGKLEGRITEQEFSDFLCLCWLLMYYRRLGPDFSMISVTPLVKGAFRKSEADSLSLEAACSWMMSTIPNVASALVDYVRTCLIETPESTTTEPAVFSGQLTPGRAWALGLSQKDYIGKAFLLAFFQSEVNLLYRSSLHGKGMNRFWAHVEGYKGPAVLLFSVLPPEEGASPFVIGAVMPGGLENKNSFYGSNDTCLAALEPEFLILRANGREKNYVYTHKAAGGGYAARPVPDGIGFGGDIGSERVWLSDDFSMLKLRHYAMDKTFEPGFLVPQQGYTPLEAQLLEVELWGLGGKDAEQQMLQFQQRESLFAEQRRKVDLKAFGDWQDSPEKMMMDMLSNPNRPRREERCDPSA